MATKKREEKAKDLTQHISSKPFSEMLADFSKPQDSMSNPMGGSRSGMSPAMMRDIKFEGSREKPKKEKRDRPEPGLMGDIDIDDNEPLTFAKIHKEVEAMGGDDYTPEFDSFIEGIFEENDDVTLKNSLTALGRKYAVKGLEDTESSEVSRAFSRQEQQVNMLIEEYTAATMDVSKEIESMRAVRSRGKPLADMMSVRASLLAGKLSAIKELNATTKNKFDLSLKLKKDKDGSDSNTDMMASQTIQKMFSIGRKNLLSAERDDDIVSHNSDDEMEDMAENVMRSGMQPPDSITDGDKFIEYENAGIEYVLDIGDDGRERQVYAINRDGDIVTDYPMPSNIEDLHFAINEMSGEATDQLQRSYRVRKNGTDIIERYD